MEFQPEGVVKLQLTLPDGSKEEYSWNKVTIAVLELPRAMETLSLSLLDHNLHPQPVQFRNRPMGRLVRRVHDSV